MQITPAITNLLLRSCRSAASSRITTESSRSELLHQVTVPTLVMHKREDQVQPFETGRELAAGIPGARFVALQGQNHIPLEQDPETARMLEEIKRFLKRN